MTALWAPPAAPTAWACERWPRPPLPHLNNLTLRHACLSGADVSGVLSSAPWLATLTSLKLCDNPLGAPGHRALSLLHLPRLQSLFLHDNGFNGAGLAALVSAPWLTQLTRLHLFDAAPASARSFVDVADAIEDDARVFGRLRRAGCIIYSQLIDRADELLSGDEVGSDEVLGSDGEAGSDADAGSDDELGDEFGGDG